MSLDDHDDGLATQYVLARRQRPDLDVSELAKIIISRLDRDQVRRYAEEARAWAPQPADRQELALSYVRNFVLAMEAHPDEDPG